MFKNTFAFRPNGCPVEWFITALVVSFCKTDPNQTRIEFVVPFKDEFGSPISRETSDVFFDEIAEYAESQVGYWYDEYMQEQSYSSLLAFQHDNGEDPRHYGTLNAGSRSSNDDAAQALKESMPALPGVPRTLQIDSSHPITPNSPYHSFI